MGNSPADSQSMRSRDMTEGNKTEPGNRKTYIEWLRVTGMISVILFHIGSAAFPVFTDSWDHSFGGFFFQSVTNIAHFAVPVFFMISGALLLTPDREIPINKLVRRYILRYCLVILTFGFFFSIIQEFFALRSVTPSLFTEALKDTLSGNTWTHMWFVYTYIGILCVLPLLRGAVKTMSREEMRFTLLAMILFVSIKPFLDYITGFSVGIGFPLTGYAGLGVLYFLLGYYIDNHTIRIRKSIRVLLILLSLLLLTGTAYLKVFRNCSTYIEEYPSPVVLALSAGIFSAAKENQAVLRTNSVISWLSQMSFGVYLIHLFWIHIAYKVLSVNPMEPTIATGLLIAAASFGLSVLTVTLLKKIPLLKNIV